MTLHQSNRRDQNHIINLLQNRNGNVANFSLLIGAGASVTSGIKAAGSLMSEWQRELHRLSKTTEQFDKWLDEQTWHGDDDEYSILFETVYDQPAQRRIVIEGLVDDAKPYWGYVYLTNLMAQNVFNIVLTTNFDDLLNEASYLYSANLRPQVASFDSAIDSIRLTSNRPKIIKLHGDFLYDNIKNTIGELETLEENTRKKIGAMAQEYGLIVVGYSGRDRSVMDALEVFLRSEGNFKHGIYWCMPADEKPGKRLTSLLRKERVYRVDITGFDQLMAETHQELGFPLPIALRQPFRFAEERAQLFVNTDDFRIFEHPIIGADRSQVLEEIQKGPSAVPADNTPPLVMAGIAAERGDVEDQLRYLDEALRADPDDQIVAYLLAEALAENKKYPELSELVARAKFTAANKSYFLLLAGENDQVLQHTARVLKAGDVSEQEHHIMLINRAIAYRRLKDIPSMEEEIKILIADGGTEEPSRGIAIQAGIFALRCDKPNLLITLEEAVNASQITQQECYIWPLFESYVDDIDYKKLVTELFTDEDEAEEE